jgi:hypothetical protein
MFCEGKFAMFVLLVLVATTRAQIASFDDELAGTFDREMAIHDVVELKLPEEMGADDELRAADPTNNSVDKFLWQSKNSPQRVPFPRDLTPEGIKPISDQLFDLLFKPGMSGLGQSLVSTSSSTKAERNHQSTSAIVSLYKSKSL